MAFSYYDLILSMIYRNDSSGMNLGQFEHDTDSNTQSKNNIPKILQPLQNFASDSLKDAQYIT